MSEHNDPQASPPPAAQPESAPPGAGGYGSLGKRFLARIIDALLVGIPLNILLAVIPGVRLGGVIASAVISVVAFAYYLLLESSRGATFGKQWLGMAVTDDARNTPISVDASMRRNWWLLLGVVSGVPVIGLLASLASLVIVILIATTISSSDRNQGWHDKLAGTLVVERASA